MDSVSLNLTSLAIAVAAIKEDSKDGILAGALRLLTGDDTVSMGVLNHEFIRLNDLKIIISLESQWMLTPRGKRSITDTRVRLRTIDKAIGDG